MAKEIVMELNKMRVTHVYLEGDDEIMDILRLTCLEAGMTLETSPDNVVLKYVGQEYRIVHLK